MNADFTRWAAELAQDYEEEPMDCVCGHPESQHAHYRAGEDCVVCGCMTYNPPQRISATITIGWLLILAFLVLVFIGAAWVGSHIIQWVTS
jgi:hypothetical protein